MRSLFRQLDTSTIVLFFMSIILILILAVNASAAWLFGNSTTFSAVVIGDLSLIASISSEASGDLEVTTPDLLPGEIINRTLEIINPLSSESGYVRIKCLFEIDMEQGAGFQESLAVQMQLAVGQTDWGTGQSGPQYFYYYDYVIVPGQTIEVNLQFIVFPTATNDNYGLTNEEAGKPYKIQVIVEAIQMANNAKQAWISSDAPVGWPS
jgi:hypothetical protein